MGSALAIFQHVMESLLQTLPKVCMLTDDILVTAWQNRMAHANLIEAYVFKFFGQESQCQQP